MKHHSPPWRAACVLLALLFGTSAALAVQISFPASFPAVRGTTIDIPITIGDVTGLNVYSFELQFTFSTTAMTLVDVIEAGTLSEAWSANEYHEVTGTTARIVAAGSTALTGSGTLIYARFNLPLSGSGSSSLTWTQASCRLNEGSPALTFVNGYVSITNPPTISFSPNTATMFAGDSVYVSVYGGTSPYVFAVSNPLIGSFNQTSPAAGYFRSLAPGTTTIQATDASLIVGTSGAFIVRAVKLVIPDSTILSGRTFLMPVKILLAASNPPAAPESLVAARFDTMGMVLPRLYWVQRPGVSYDVYHHTSMPFLPGDPGVIHLPNVTDELPGDPHLFRYADWGVNLLAPGTTRMFYLVTAVGAGAVTIHSGQFRVSWSATVLNLVGTQRAGTLLESWSFQYEPHTGYVDVSFSSDQALPGNGTLFYLELYVVPGSGSTTLTLSNVLFNEDQYAILDDGSVTRIAPPTITVSPGSPQETVVGDSIQFSVSGGTAPYTWNVTNPATGNVTSTGRFRATGGGLTYVWVQDANGFTDSSALVTVDDFRLVVQSLTAHQGDSVTVNVNLVGSATGLGVYSTDIRLRVASSFTFAYPIVTGTLLDGWLVASEANANVIRVAASNGLPLAGSGTFLQLRGRVAPGASGTRSMTIDAVNLNEGNRRAYRVDGTLTILNP